MTVDNCACNGALFGSQVFNGGQWQEAGAQIASIEDATVADGTSLNPPLATSNVNVSTGNDKDGNPVVIVKVSYTFKPLIGFPGIPAQVDLVRTAQMRIAAA